MASRVSCLLHVSTPSKYCERCCKALVTVTSRLLYVFSAARFCKKTSSYMTLLMHCSWFTVIIRVHLWCHRQHNVPCQMVVRHLNSMQWVLITYYNIKFWVNVHHSTCETDTAQWSIKFKISEMVNGKPTGASFQSVLIPLSSTTGSADTLCSTKIPRAV